MADDRNHIQGIRRIAAANWPSTYPSQVAHLAQYIQGLLTTYAERGGPIDMVNITVRRTDGGVAVMIDGDKGVTR